MTGESDDIKMGKHMFISGYSINTDHLTVL